MQQSDAMSKVTLEYPKSKTGLHRRLRLGETLIQAILFLSGFVSIFITIGIVYELGKESMLFFTKRQWEDSNKTLATGVGPDTIEFLLSEGGSAITDDTAYSFWYNWHGNYASDICFWQYDRWWNAV